MKECNKVFFGESGLSSTSANHLANLAKETVESNKRVLDSVGFINVTIGLLSGGNSRSIVKGNNDAFLDNVPTLLKEVASSNAFCAWVREAIKAKEEEVDLVDKMDWVEYAKLKDLAVPEMPFREPPMSELDALATLNIAERMEYYELEAEASVIGKYIHPGMPFSKARTNLLSRVCQPNEVRGEGVNAIVYSYDPSCNSDKVEDTFFVLQQKHRDISARLNKIKFNLKKIADDHNAKAAREYQSNLQIYHHKVSELDSACNVYKADERKRLLGLKIVIPHALQETYEKLNKLVQKEQV